MKSRESINLLSLKEAQANQFKIDWDNFEEPIPQQGNQLYDNVELEEIASYIDWSPFFGRGNLKELIQKFFLIKIMGNKHKVFSKMLKLILKI